MEPAPGILEHIAHASSKDFDQGGEARGFVMMHYMDCCFLPMCKLYFLSLYAILVIDLCAIF